MCGALSSTTGSVELGLPALGSFLWSARGTPDLDGCALANVDLREAIHALAPVDYRNIGSEELGRAYESLLELHERKESGSYYTPPSLIESLLDAALDPILRNATKQPNPVDAILTLRVCDPACGSGHSLIAAAHRIANSLAAVRTGDDTPSPAAVRIALRDVVGQCLYGVDVNPMAVELCTMNLWLEALGSGTPLSCLEPHIQCGNSLLGATPALLDAGIPDEAFDATDADDKALCRALKQRNREERASFKASPPAGVADGFDTCSRLWADSWCAAFVWPKTTSQDLPPITEEIFRTIARNPSAVPIAVRDEIRRLADRHGFLHWHLAFPGRGFDLILGNPPWVRQKALGRIKPLLTRFASYAGTADLSVFFVNLALEIVGPGGVVALLTPNKWFRSSYGKPLRAYVRAHADPELIVDFGHSRTLFPDADTFPAAVVVKRTGEGPRATTFRFVEAFDEVRAKTPLRQLVAEGITVPVSQLTSERWELEASPISQLFQSLMQRGTPLARSSSIRRCAITCRRFARV